MSGNVAPSARHGGQTRAMRDRFTPRLTPRRAATAAALLTAVWVLAASVTLAACGSEAPAEDSPRFDVIDSRLAGQMLRIDAAAVQLAELQASLERLSDRIARQHAAIDERLASLEGRSTNLESFRAEVRQALEGYAETLAGLEAAFGEGGQLDQLLQGLVVGVETGPE